MVNRIPDNPPKIDPLCNDVKRPQWSIMIPTYNCISFLTKTLECILEQDYGEEHMQIEVVDDCSTDGDVRTLVQAVGKGRILFHRQKHNLGSLRNFETCLKRSRGRWIHILHGDDLVKPGFYEEIEKLFSTYSEVGAAFTGTIHINEKGDEGHQLKKLIDRPGIIQNWLHQISQGQCLQAPAIVVKRTVFEHLGGFFGAHYGEDWEMYVRIAAYYPVAYSPRNLALYRVHANNISTKYSMNGQNIKDIQKIMEVIKKYLPQKDRQHTLDIARRNFSIYFLKVAHEIYKVHKNRKAALKQANRALLMHINKTTIYLIIRLYLKCFIYRRQDR